MYPLRQRSVIFVAMALLAVACRQQPAAVPIEIPIPAAEASRIVDIPGEVGTMTLASPTTVPASTTTLPTATPPPRITAVPTGNAAETERSMPNPTPVAERRLRLAAPIQWQEVVSRALDGRQSTDGDVTWELVVTEDPRGTLQQGTSDVALMQGDEGIIAFQEPVALAVPWTTDWEHVSLDLAREIVEQGHPLVTLIPWHQLTPSLKSLRVDGRMPLDDGYPFEESWSLIPVEGLEREAMGIASHLRNAREAMPRAQLTAVGDIMLDRSLGNAILQGNLAYPFSSVADHLKNADVTVGNLESALGDVGQPVDKHYTFRAPPAAASALAQAGFDIVSLANNHAMDYGPETLLQGISLLRAQGVTPVGAGANVREAHGAAYLNVHDLTIAFLGYVNVPVEVGGFDTESWAATPDAPGLAWATTEAISRDVSAARSGADLVVVLLHSGFEYIEEPGEAQVAAAHAAVDAGADLVLGHHAHLLQGIEFYGEGVIVYGLGNFAFQIEGPPESAILNVWLDRTGVRQVELIPVIVQFGGQPRLADAAEAGQIRRHVHFLTTLLNPR